MNRHSMIHVRSLGTLSVAVNGEPITANKWLGRKTREIFKYLVHDRDTPVPDEQLMEAVWPGGNPSTVRRSLWARLSELRRILSDTDKSNPLIAYENKAYIFYAKSDRVEIDVDLFTKHIEKGLIENDAQHAISYLNKGLQLYKGDYYADDPYCDHWKAKRQTLHRLYVQGYERKVSIYEQTGDLPSAIDTIRHLIDRTPPNEAQYRHLMRLLYASGNRSEAIRTFERCRTFLDKELGAQPMPETLQLMTRILRQQPVFPESNQSRTIATVTMMPRTEEQRPPRSHLPQKKWPFLGRTRELTSITDACRRLGDGDGSVLWISGPSGMGKTRLTKEALTHYAGPYLQIRCHPFSQNVPFSGILDGLRESFSRGRSTPSQMARKTDPLSKLHNLFEPTSTKINEPDPIIRNTRLRQIILHAVEQLCDDLPLVFHIDDVDLLDPSSSDIVASLGRRTYDLPLLLLITSHHVPEKTSLGGELLRSAPTVDSQSLKPLSFTELRPLLGPGHPSPWSLARLQNLHERTQGDPLMLVEHLNWLETNQFIRREDERIVFHPQVVGASADQSSSKSLIGSAGFQDQMDRRLGQLSDQARSLLYRIAVFHEPINLTRLEQLADPNDRYFMSSFEQLLISGFVEQTDPNKDIDRYSINHLRVRQFLYHSMPLSHRRWLHRQIADMLIEEIQQSPPDDRREPFVARAVRAAEHAKHACQWDEATKWYQEAARKARGWSGSTEAVSLYRQADRAAQNLASDNKQRQSVQKELTESLYHFGAFSEVLPLLEDELQRASNTPHCTSDTFHLKIQLTMTHLQLNHTKKALNFADQVAADAKIMDGPALGTALSTTAFLYYRMGEATKALKYGQSAIDHLGKRADPGDIAEHYNRLGVYYLDLAQYDQAIQCVKQSISHHKASGNNEGLTRSINNLGLIYQLLFCPQHALKAHREALRLATEGDHLLLTAESRRNIGMDLFYAGEEEKALTILGTAWQQARDLSDSPYRHENALRPLLEARLFRRETVKAEQLLAAYKKVTGPREAPFVTVYEMFLALLHGKWDKGTSLMKDIKRFWNKTGRRVRSYHTLLFAGNILFTAGQIIPGRKYLEEGLRHVDAVLPTLPTALSHEMALSADVRTARNVLAASFEL